LLDILYRVKNGIKVFPNGKPIVTKKGVDLAVNIDFKDVLSILKPTELFDFKGWEVITINFAPETFKKHNWSVGNLLDVDKNEIIYSGPTKVYVPILIPKSVSEPTKPSPTPVPKPELPKPNPMWDAVYSSGVNGRLLGYDKRGQYSRSYTIKDGDTNYQNQSWFVPVDKDGKLFKQ
jgi:hypothetical protein